MLRYRLEGSGGVPLLLIHGWGITYAIWENLAPLLTPYFRLIMIELPGLGGSPEGDPQKPYYESCAEAINEVRNVLGIEQWSLLAYSTGTRAAEAYVRRYPQTVTRVVFLCPVYLQEIWALCLRLFTAPHSKTLYEWMLSDWRLYNGICAFGFNWHRHDYTYAWQNEIELQPIDTLVRSLAEIPGKGRAPFDVPAVPTLFVWGSHDALTAKPRRLRPIDILIPANHSAPMLAAAEVAAAVLPFLTTGQLQTQESNATRQRIIGKRRAQGTRSARGSRSTRGTGSAQGAIPTAAPFLFLRTSSRRAVRSIWRTALYRRNKRSTRSKKELRLVSRLRNNRNKRLNKAEERRGKTNERHLLGRRQKKLAGTTHAETSSAATARRRFSLEQSNDNHDSTTRAKYLFFRRPDRTGM